MEHVHRDAPHHNLVPLIIIADLVLGQRGEHGGIDPLHIPLVNIDRGVGEGCLQPRHTAGVVIMGMGEENGGQGKAVLLQHLQDGAGVSAGIDDGTELLALISQNIAVGADGAHRHGLDEHGKHLTYDPYPAGW